MTRWLVSDRAREGLSRAHTHVHTRRTQGRESENEKNGERLFERATPLPTEKFVVVSPPRAGVKSYDNRSVKRVQGLFHNYRLYLDERALPARSSFPVPPPLYVHIFVLRN